MRKWEDTRLHASKALRPTRKLLAGGDGIAVEEFLWEPVEHWVKR